MVDVTIDTVTEEVTINTVNETVILDTGTVGAAATIAVGTVTTGDPGTDAIVTNVGTSSAAVFDITIPRGDAGAGAGNVEGPASAVDSNFPAFDTTTGKLIKDSGVSAASFATAAQGAKVDFLTVTQPVDLDQLEADIAALANGMVYKGVWDASAGTFPGAGAAQTGWFYYVSVGGTVDGVEFSIGDNIVATADNASAATYAANWSKHDQTDAVQSVAGLVGTISASSLRAALDLEAGTDFYSISAADAAFATAAQGALAVTAVQSGSDLTALKALDTSVTTLVYIKDDLRGGIFEFRAGDYSALVAADTLEGVYVEANDTADTSGAWVRFDRRIGEYEVRWFGASPANANNKPNIDAMATLAIAEGGGKLLFGQGEYTVTADLATWTVDAVQSLFVEGISKKETAIVFGASCTKGLHFNSTSTVDQQRPEFAVDKIELRPGTTDQGKAVIAEWADADYSYGGFRSYETFISAPGSTVNWEQGYELTNAKHLIVDDITGHGTYGTNTPLEFIKLLGDCITPKMSRIYALGWLTGIEIDGTTEGVYVDLSEIVGGANGIIWENASGLEPVLNVTKTNIHTSLFGIKASNVSEANIERNTFFCYGALDGGSPYTAVEVDGANSRNWKVAKNHIRTDALGRAADTLIGINLKTGTGYVTDDNTVQGESGFPFAIGINVASGVTALNLDQPVFFTNVTTPISAAGTSYQPYSIGAAGFMNLGLGTNGIAIGASFFPLGDGSYNLGFPTTNRFGKVFFAPATLAGLGTAAAAGIGARAMCSDSTTTTFGATVTGGGANLVPVWSDGTNWIVG